MASAGCAISTRRGRSRSRPWRASWCANGSPAAGGATRRPGRWTWSAAASSPGCRMPALLLDGARKRPYAAIMRSLDEQVLHLSAGLAECAGRLSAPAGADRAGEGRSVHRRPRPPARLFGAAAGGRAGAPDPPRRRPHQPQPGDPHRADARSAAAAAMLRRAQHQAGTGAVGGHRAHGTDAAHVAVGRRPARALQRRRLHGARCAGHRAGLRRQPADRASHGAAIGIPAHCARRDGDRHGCRRAARSRAGRQRLRRLPVVRDEHRQRSAARQCRPADRAGRACPRRGALDGQPQHAVPQ